jgi:hypothetical protein
MDSVCDFRIIFCEKTGCQCRMQKDRREVRNLIFVLSSASFIAFLAVAALVYYLGSSGTYLLRNVLISPKTLKEHSFMGYDPYTRSNVAFVLDKIEFVPATKRGGPFAVDMQAYTSFYKLVSAERSVPVLTDKMVAQFQASPASTLTIFARPSDNGGSLRGEKIFQQVQFSDRSELFRVQFRPSESSAAQTQEWIYFRYPEIHELTKIFVPLNLSHY